MYDPFIRWYRESATTPVLSQQVEIFAMHGIRLHHPNLGTVMAIDIEGNDVPVSQEELTRLLELRISSINLNWWFSSDSHLVAKYSYDPLGCEIQTFWLDGLTVEEGEKVEAALMAAATNLPVLTRALVIDRRGLCEPDNWDSPILYEGETVPEFPDRVITQEQIAAGLLQDSPELAREEIQGGLVQLTRYNSA